jgi:hypothetical protein
METPTEHQEHTVTQHNKPKRTVTVSTKALAGCAVLVLVVLLSFVGGMQYQKSKQSATSAVAVNGNSQQFGALGGASGGGFGGRDGQMNGSFGSVTEISASSITVKDQRANATKTYAITSSTAITDNGNTVAYDDISVGDNVMVTTASSSSTDATQITVNPSMGSPRGTTN